MDVKPLERKGVTNTQLNRWLLRVWNSLVKKNCEAESSSLMDIRIARQYIVLVSALYLESSLIIIPNCFFKTSFMIECFMLLLVFHFIIVEVGLAKILLCNKNKFVKF